MDLIGGYPFWLMKDGLPYVYPALEHNTSTDVVIIGGGISGALMGYYLAEAGVNCIIADARSIGLGSTCASTALLQYEIDTPLHILKDTIGLQNAVTAYKLCEEAIHKISVIDKRTACNEFEAKKSLYYAAYKKHEAPLKKEYQLRKENDFKVSYLDDKAIKTSFGFSAPAAILSQTAAQINAYKLTHSLHQYSIKKGIQVYDRTAVTKIQHQKRAVVLTTAAGYSIKAKTLVFANGYEAVNYIDKKIVDLHTTYAVISEQCNSNINFWQEEALIWNTADPYLYMRTTKDRRIITGGRDERFYSPAKRDTLIEHKSKLLQRDLKKIFPALPFKPEFAWAGTFGATKDGLPFIGALPSRPNSYFSLGYGGNGITFSLIGAAIITDLITTGQSKYKELFAFTR
jgi:glycine/D-amino acid oxidase-like deaminating enzyme